MFFCVCKIKSTNKNSISPADRECSCIYTIHSTKSTSTLVHQKKKQFNFLLFTTLSQTNCVLNLCTILHIQQNQLYLPILIISLHTEHILALKENPDFSFFITLPQIESVPACTRPETFAKTRHR